MHAKDDVQEIVEDVVDALRDDLEESIQNLHTDCLRQFQRQSEEIVALLEKQRHDTREILEENRKLREENDSLRKHF